MTPTTAGGGGTDPLALRRRLAAVTVGEVTAEVDPLAEPTTPVHLAGPPGSITLQLRTMLRRVSMGAGLARSEGLVEAVRALPGVPGVVTSPVGGTFIVGGPGWLGLCAVGVPPPAQPMPLDWMTDSLLAWFDLALAEYGIEARMGRVDNAWCPGFSDLAVGGRKLAGLGFRVTRDLVVMRGVVPVAPISEPDLALLAACHELIGLPVRRQAVTSLAEATKTPHLAVSSVLERWREVRTEVG